MAAVARNIISLLDHLNFHVPVWHEQKPLSSTLKVFQTPLFSIPPPNQSINVESASHGFYADMFAIGIARGRSNFGKDDLGPNGTWSLYFNQGDLEVIKFPGSDALRLGKPPVDAGTLKYLFGTLDDMTASFINSGPY